jgi:hypothetical protein
MPITRARFLHGQNGATSAGNGQFLSKNRALARFVPDALGNKKGRPKAAYRVGVCVVTWRLGACVSGGHSVGDDGACSVDAVGVGHVKDHARLRRR